MAKSKSKTEKLPSYNTPMRKYLLNSVATFQDYQDKLQEGYPLRTEEELKEIESRFEDGLIFDEINQEQAKKNPMIKLKKPTFRKYIQDSILPPSIKYRLVKKKRLAVFPSDIITHINFIYYFYQIADHETVDAMLAFMKLDLSGEITLLEAIESMSERQNIYADVYYYIGFDDGDIEFTIKKVLKNKPRELKSTLNRLYKIDEKFQSIIKEVDRFKSYLEQQNIKISEIPEDINPE